MRLRCLVYPPYKGSGLLIFSAGLGADRCLGWGWVLLRFAVFARTARPGVSGSGALATGGGCLRPGLAWPCLGAVLCRGLGLSWLAVCVCSRRGVAPACAGGGSSAAIQLADCWRL